MVLDHKDKGQQNVTLSNFYQFKCKYGLFDLLSTLFAATLQPLAVQGYVESLLKARIFDVSSLMTQDVAALLRFSRTSYKDSYLVCLFVPERASKVHY